MAFLHLDPVWFAAGCLVCGVACGTTLRFLPFAVGVALAAALLLAVGLIVDHSPLAGLIALVALQLGYGLGVIARAAIRSYLDRRGGPSSI
jgi:hypothetical protein